MTDSNEIREQIEQEKDLLRILRNNRHHLAMQQAKLGGAPDLSLINQIDWHDTQIDLHEQEIKRLETESVVDRVSLAEATYQRLFAEQLENEYGRLTVVGQTRLEELRLGLGIPIKRSKELEQEIRFRIAREAFADVDPDSLMRLVSLEQMAVYTLDSRMANTLRYLGRVIRIDPNQAAELIWQTVFPAIDGIGSGFTSTVINSLKIGPYSYEREIFERCFYQLKILKPPD